MKIERDADQGRITIRLIGRLQAEHVAGIKAEIEGRGGVSVLCLKDVTLVDVEVVRFLGSCEESDVTLVNCSAYIREWINREREQKD